jgi:predicted enzyme related to lactoylglutathione lyase
MISTAAVAEDAAKAPLLDKITIAVEDISKMKDFYGKTFQIVFTDAIGSGATLATAKIGALEVLLCPKKLAGITATQNTVQLEFSITDLDATYLAAMKNGGSSITKPQLVSGIRTAAVRDPDGNSIVFRENRLPSGTSPSR